MNAVNFYAGLIDWVFSHVRDLHEYMFLIQSFVTCTALFWLLKRAWEVLWTPLPKLIGILGVEVPEPPEVSLACIKSDSLTLHWTPSTLNRAVVRYLIQVNGVNVGESTPQGETIIIEGLKPGHFYNVRVIAVGTNNFQAGSRVIRLRTLGRDGVALQGTARDASTLSNGIQQDASQGGDTSTVRAHGVTSDPTITPSTTAQVIVRDSGSSHPGQRRNTGNAGGRKHSPSTAGADSLPSPLLLSSDDSPGSIQELQRKQDAAQKEVEDATSQGQKESEDMKNQISSLSKEKEDKTQIYKDKEEASEKLRKEVNTLERQNREAQTRKGRKEKDLQRKKAERKKMQDDQKRWQRELTDMETERESLKSEKEKIGKDTEARCKELRADINNARNRLDQLGKEIEKKGKHVKKLEDERQSHRGGGNEAESSEWDAEEKQLDAQFELEERMALTRIQDYDQKLRSLQMDYQGAQAHITALYARQANNPLMYHGNSSGVDFDPTGTQGKAKSRRQRNRKSRTNTLSSPTAAFSMLEAQFPGTAGGFNLNSTSSPSYVAPPPYMDPLTSNDTASTILPGQPGGMHDADFHSLTAGAPLSPTAKNLLPSNIFENDDELPDVGDGAPAYTSDFPQSFSPANQYNDLHSPGSSRSASILSSPHASTHNLAKYGVKSHDYGLDNDQRALDSPGANYGAIGSPARTDHASAHRNFGSMFTALKKSGGTSQDGLALGSLKPGQSHSFPRSTDEPETASSRNRRISFSSGFSGFLNRNPTVGESSEGNGPAPARQTSARRPYGFHMFGIGADDRNSLRSVRDPSSPRPLSIASSDLPRPSTDSAPFGWGAAIDGTINKNSPLVTDWSIHAPQTWSANPSRRPSGQHGSSSALNFPEKEDEVWPRESLKTQSSPPPMGIIGTRPSSSNATARLNPTAPKFELPQTNQPVLSRLLRAGKGKGKAIASDQYHDSDHVDDPSPHTNQSSPTESRKSRDARSIHTQNSVADSTDSLERTTSNAASDMTKDKESSIRQLFRKGSSFGFQAKARKKGGSSTAASDRADREDNLDEYGEDGVGGKSVESVANSGMDSSDAKAQKAVGASKERKNSTWGRAFGRKKGRESDVERSEAETTGPEDE